MAEFFDISNWNEKPWYQTGGTRDKVIVENPNDHTPYYFKTSLKKLKIDYKYEFWSEIIASEIGLFLGFDMLKYDIAIKNDEIGCISKSMVTEGKNKLTEGISYLTGFDTTYNPDDKDSKKQYTFQLICQSLEYFQLDRYIKNIIEITILDSIIGNGDRHQENWGIITEYSEVIQLLEDMAQKGFKGLLSKSLFYFLGVTSKTKKEETDKLIKKFNLYMPGKFSQIYDSGSCLGREIDDTKIKKMLSDLTMMGAYIHRGVSEIHWEGEKLSHFDLIQKIYQQYPDLVIKIVERIKKRHNLQAISELVENVDTTLPVKFKDHKLPDLRKEFVIKLIDLRIETLLRKFN